MSAADQLWWFGLLVGLGSVPMTAAMYHRLVREEQVAWMKRPELAIVALGGQLVAPIGVVALAWLAWT